jgi:hypothetical protein
MGVIKFIVVVALVGFGYQYWNKNHSGAAKAAAEAATKSANGFVAVPPADGASDNAVTVLAAENCPEDAARRADALVSDLGRKGIPVVRAHRVSFTMAGPDSAAAAQRVTAIMNGELPVVLVRGKARSNPTLEEVIAEYRGR